MKYKDIKSLAKDDAKREGRDWREVYKFYKSFFKSVDKGVDPKVAMKKATDLHLARHYRDLVNDTINTRDPRAMNTLAEHLKEAIGVKKDGEVLD